MVKLRSLSRTDAWFFGIPFAILVVLPLLGWLAVYAITTRDGLVHEPIVPEPMWFVLCGVIFWGSVPGALVREPFFDTEIVGYSPHGLLGWAVIVLFWLAVSLVISFTLRYVTRYAQRRRHI
jgi:hypothetical protein